MHVMFAKGNIIIFHRTKVILCIMNNAIVLYIV